MGLQLYIKLLQLFARILPSVFTANEMKASHARK